MAITSYSELIVAVQNWLNRQDATTLARIPEFIDLAEKRLQRRQAWFEELYSVANGVPLSVTSNPLQLPNYIRRPLVVFNATSLFYRPLPIVPLEHIRDLMQRNLNAAGTPQYATFFSEVASTPALQSGALTIDLTTITIDQTVFTQATETALGPLYLMLWPQPATTNPSALFTVDMQYIRKLPPLAIYNTNALLVEHPDLYLYATLLESAPYLQHDDRIAVWTQEFEIRSREMDAERERIKYGATPRRPRLPNPLG